MEADTRKPKKWMKIANELNCKFVTTHVLMLLFKNPARLPCLLCLAPIRFTLPCPICFALPLKNAIMTIAMSSYPSSPYFLSLHFLLSLSLSLSLCTNSQTKHRTEPSSIKPLMLPCKPKFSCKNRLFEPSDCYCTTALQSEWDCFRRVVKLPLLPAVGVTVLAPYPHLNPIVILLEGYTSSKIQCLTSVSWKSSFWYPHLDASALSACLKFIKGLLACMQDC